MKTINIHAAKRRLSSLVAEVEAPLPKNDFRQSFGMMKGRIHMKENF
jgi:hypothetical protein